jgi:hypothetical protein
VAHAIAVNIPEYPLSCPAVFAQPVLAGYSHRAARMQAECKNAKPIGARLRRVRCIIVSFAKMLRSNKQRGASTTNASKRFQESRCGFDSRAPS